jgi:phosphocarrier protein HPr
MAEAARFQRTVTIVNLRGLHARAAARFAERAEAYDCEITVSRGGETVSGRSIMGLLLLAAARECDIDIATDGEDAEEAIEALCALVADGFGESDEEET